MATVIEYGGKPSYAIRVEASKADYGSQLSGYTGLIPGMKYSAGTNFSILTHRLASKFDNYKHPPVGYSGKEGEGAKSTDKYIKEHIDHLKNELSVASREQRYVFDLPPGYGGYIPKYETNALGRTFRKVTFKALENEVLERIETRDHLNGMKDEGKKMACLKAIVCENDVSLGLKKTVDHMYPCGYPSQRRPTEAPIEGYMGFVPRTKALTESLGMGFKREATFGLKTFDCYQKYYQGRLDNPQVYLSNEVSQYRPSVNDDVCMGSKVQYRIYPSDGMKPRYTGVVPGLLFDYGRTYGDATRSRECCQHKEANFGIHMQKKLATSPNEYSQIIS